MFGRIFKRLKGATSGLTDSALSVSDEKAMEAIIAAMCKVAYADGECQNEEVDKVNAMIQSHPLLKDFHNEPARLFDSYCDQMEASFIMGSKAMDTTIAKVLGDDTTSEVVLISAIEVASASTEENEQETVSINKDEEKVLSEIAKLLDLRLGKYL